MNIRFGDIVHIAGTNKEVKETLVKWKTEKVAFHTDAKIDGSGINGYSEAILLSKKDLYNFVSETYGKDILSQDEALITRKQLKTLPKEKLEDIHKKMGSAILNHQTTDLSDYTSKIFNYYKNEVNKAQKGLRTANNIHEIIVSDNSGENLRQLGFSVKGKVH